MDGITYLEKCKMKFFLSAFFVSISLLSNPAAAKPIEVGLRSSLTHSGLGSADLIMRR